MIRIAIKWSVKKLGVLCGAENAEFIKSLLNDKFFMEVCNFSALQRRKSDDVRVLLQAMLLLDKQRKKYEYASLSDDELMRYAVHIKTNYSEKQKERLYDIIDYLEKVFPVWEKRLRKKEIPIVILCADLAMGDEYNGAMSIYRIETENFRRWFNYFFENMYEEYSLYCSVGSNQKEKVVKRVEIMEKAFREYMAL